MTMRRHTVSRRRPHDKRVSFYRSRGFLLLVCIAMILVCVYVREARLTLPGVIGKLIEVATDIIADRTAPS